MAGLRGGRLVVTDDGRGVALQVVSRLAVAGIDARVCTAVPPDAYGVIHLGGLADIGSVEDALAIQREVFTAARGVARRFAADGGVFVTVQDTGGDFGLDCRRPDRAWLGGIAALTRTAAREWPAASVKAIDCEWGNRTSAAVADAIVQELLRGGPTVCVGLRADGTRSSIQVVPAPVQPAGDPRIGPESVIVATGGACGVTAEALRALALAHRPRLVLLDRAPLAAPEVAATLAELRAAGSETRYLVVDPGDGPALKAALDDVRHRWGPITGVIHGAGAGTDRQIADKTDEQFDRVFEAKVEGLRGLLDATAHDPLTLLCVLSSLSAHVGDPGQCDQAMADEVLNQVARAERARHPERLVRAIGWGPAVNPSLAAHAFVAELSGAGAETQVVIARSGPVDGGVALPKGEIHLAVGSHPYLADHNIAGTPVVPVALVLEWFTAAARAWLPESGPAVIRNVNVLRKMGLGGYAAGGNRFTVQGTRDAGAHLNLELLGDGGSRHYRAKASVAAGARPADWPVPTDLKPIPPDVYDGRMLFHGPQFQVIREVQGVSAAGAAAVLTGARDMGWNRANWQTDPAAIDGGLQIAVLWAKQALGCATLPMGVMEYRTFQTGLYGGPTRCVVRARDVWSGGAECDIAFLGEDGTVRAELFGVSLVPRPA